MPKKFLKQYIPDQQKLRQIKCLRIFGNGILVPNLWHLNRKSVSGAFAIGLFCAFIPLPFQMLLAAAGALIFQVNLPLSVASVWITNPITIPPIFYSAYVVGTWVLHTPIQEVEFSLTFDWLETVFLLIWRPFLLGCFLLGLISSLFGYLFSRWVWQILVRKNWYKRRLLRQNR